MTPDRYTCEDVFRRLDDYLDRELDAREQELMQQHLETCAVCASEYKFEETVLKQVRSKVRRIAVPQDLFQRISKVLEAEPDPGSGQS